MAVGIQLSRISSIFRVIVIRSENGLIRVLFSFTQLRCGNLENYYLDF